MKTKMLLFDNAHRIVLADIIGKNIYGYNDWQDTYIKSKDFPSGVPRQPHITYKNKGWQSWGHWLGTGNVSNVKKNNLLLSYDSAAEFIKRYVAQYNITSRNDWFQKFTGTNLLPSNLPLNPQRAYKNKGWQSWGRWLGTGNMPGGFCCRKYVVNNHFFDVWSADMAYVLGFWWADGCMKDHRRWSIYQHKNDRYLLHNILNVMESNYPVQHDKRGCCFFEISSEMICKKVCELGGTTKKSLTIHMPDVPSQYLRDFVRGVFDGDGCITYDKYNKQYMSYISSGSNIFLSQMQKRLSFNEIFCVKNAQISIKFNATNTRSLGNFMYYNHMNEKLRMIRKHEKFMIANTLSMVV